MATEPPQGGATAASARQGAVDRPRNGVGVAALVVGVVSLVLAVLVIFFPIAGVLAIIAIILGAVGMGRASRGVADNRGQALAGLITGLLALLIAIGLGIAVGSFFINNANDFRKLGSCFNQAETRAEKRACARTFSNRIED